MAFSAPGSDDREALAAIVKQVSQKFGGPSMAEFANDPPIRKHYAVAEAILAGGFHRLGLQEDLSDTDLIAWHAEQVEALRPFTRSSAHLKAAMIHAATVRALRAKGEPSEAQIDAMQDILYDDNREGDRDVIRRAWRAAEGVR